MTCHDARERFSALVDGALAPQEKRSLRAHVAGCPDCGRELASFERTVGLLRAAEAVRAPAGFVDRVVAAARPVPWYRQLLRGLFVPLPAKLPLEAAAVVLVGIMVATVFRHTPELQQAAREVPSLPHSADREQLAAPAETSAPTSTAETAASSKAIARVSEPPPPSTTTARSTGEPSDETRRQARPLGSDATGAPPAPSSTVPSGPAMPGGPAVQGTPSAPLPASARSDMADARREGHAATPEAKREAPATTPPTSSRPSRDTAALEAAKSGPEKPEAPARARGAAPSVAERVRAVPDVVGRLSVDDRAASRRAVSELVSRLGGTEVVPGPADDVVEIVIPRRAWNDLVKALARIGRWAPERQPAELPADVRAAIRLE